MTRFEQLPDDVRSKLKTDIRQTNGNELLPAAVALEMYDSDVPIWTASRMQAELDTGHGRETVRKKLRTLEEIGLCVSMEANNGRIYWWNDDRSDWPIPPDVDVDRSGLTISELFEPWYAKVAFVGLVGPNAAGILVIVGVFQLSGRLSLPIAGVELFSFGLVSIMLSYVVLLYGFALAATEWATSNGVDVSLFD